MTKNLSRKQQAAAELLRRKRAQESLVDYAKYIDIPGVPPDDSETEWELAPVETGVAKHHSLLMRVFEQVVLGEVPRAMFFLCPGSAKSSYGSVVGPTWAMGKFPNYKIILSSYGSELAKKHGRRARQIVKSKKFQNVFNTRIKNDTGAADFWATENESEYMSGGILSGITGNRCVTGDTVVRTTNGNKKIEDIKEGEQVESFDFNTGRVVFRRVKAVARRNAKSIYRVQSSAGNVVEATGNHPFWAGKAGWKNASLLAEGDCLLRSLWHGNDPHVIRNDKGRKKREPGSLLWSRMYDEGIKRFKRLRGKAHMQVVRLANAATKENKEILLHRVQKRGAHPQGATPEQSPGTAMRGLRKNLPANNKHTQKPFLWERVSGYLAKRQNEQGRKSWVSPWWLFGCPGDTWAKSVQVVAPSDSKAGQQYVCGLPSYREFARTPHRPRPNQQRMGKPGNALFRVPYVATWCGERETAEDFVALAERICKPSEVWDITVEGTSCFFANGILIHNCDLLIIDDPVKGREEADSETIQKKTWEAYQDDLRTRLVPGGAEIIIQTRWSENDLSGKLLPEDYDGENGLIRCRDGRDWYVVCIPAECERNDDPLGREVGELLWPEWFTEEHFDGFKAQIRTWSALFQQRPQPPGGTFFQKEWFNRYRIGEQPAHLNHYITSDHAPGGAETDSDNDSNVVRVWGIDDAGEVWLRGGFNSRETLDKEIDKVVPLIKQFRPFCWFPEADNNWKAIAGFVRREMLKQKTHCRIEPVSPHGKDKQTKAKPIQAMASMGLVHIPEGPEGDKIIDEYSRFPTGAHDDEVDAISIIGRVIDEAHPAIVKPGKPKPKNMAQEDFDRVLGKKTGTAKNKDDL